MLTIRLATPADAAALLEIYAPYVRDTAITFEYEVPSLSEFAERIRHIQTKYPYLVAEENKTLYGYAYASDFKGRAAYAWSVETSIYVRRDTRHRGIGGKLYRALEDCLARQHVCNLCACIAYPNPESIAFHEAWGYKQAAHFHASGFKLDSWQDMIWMEKTLCPHSIPPKAFVPITEIEIPADYR